VVKIQHHVTYSFANPPLQDTRRESFRRRSLLADQQIQSDDFSEVQSALNIAANKLYTTQNVGESDFDPRAYVNGRTGVLYARKFCQNAQN